MKKKYDVLVIGGGASGMMAAIAAAENGASVLLLEKNSRLGEKLRITGGGRCNIWNQEHDVRLLLANYGKADKFLFGAFARFGLDETIDFFHRIGLETKVEAKKRAFPVSEKAEDVAGALAQQIQKLNIQVVYSASVLRLESNDAVVEHLHSTQGAFRAKNYILASGGASKPETGSNGDGFGFLEELGHAIAAPTPTITPLKIKEKWIKQLAGTTLQNVRMTVSKNGIKAFVLEGDILCTHFGISGPLILNNAYRIAELVATGAVTAKIDLFPALDEKQLDVQIIEKLKPHGAKQLKNTLRFALPPGSIKGIQAVLSSIDLDMKTGELTKEQRLLIVRILKSMPLTVAGLMGYEKAVIADGGVNIQEIDTKTMQSKIVKNLYITGDLLHINRPSGGFSLQLCWTTGYLAGSSAASD